MIAATDYMRAFAEQIRAYVPRRYVVLGTDGFGRSDTREKLRRFFEVDRHYVTRRRAEGARRRRRAAGGEGRRGDEEVRPRPGEARAVDGVAPTRSRSKRGGSPMSTIEVKVPDIGDFNDVPVIEVFVKPGDTVKAEDSLVTLESDKATMDVPSPAAGTVKEVKVKVGDKVSEGSPIVVVETGAAAPAAGAAQTAAAPAPRRRDAPRRRPRPPPAPAAAPPPAPAAAAAPAAPKPRRGRSRRPSTTKRSRPRTRRRRCASSRASSASTSRG